MNQSFSVAPVALLLLAGPSPAQDQATTLSAAARSCPIVVRAIVQAASDPSPEWHRLQFETIEVLKGSLGAAFVLLEPSGACCGRSLFALQPGDACLLFLVHRGAALHAFGGARGVLQDVPAVTAHVRALLTAPSDAALASLLAANLMHPETRVADDAAQALAVLPTLVLASSARALLVTALQDATQRGVTRAAPLVEAAVRLQDEALLDELLPVYLDANRADQAALLRKGLARCNAAEVAHRLPMHIGTMPAGPVQASNDEQRAVRAAELLTALPAADAGGALAAMLRANSNPRVQLRLAEGLLAAGMNGAQLASMVPTPVLTLAQRRLDHARPFRSIDPARR